MIVCTHENRSSDLTGVKLLILSLAQHCPSVRVRFSCPTAEDEFLRWSSRLPQVEVRQVPELGGLGWNVKPTLLLQMLDEGHEDVVWLDSDVILSGDFTPLLAGLTRQTLVATEEPFWAGAEGGIRRTVSWGLEAGRDMTRTVNSCLLRVTDEHRPLLRRWQQLLDTSEYRAAQAKPWYERPAHLMGDQDVLTALLGSRDFGEVPLQLLRRGREVVQSFDASTYTVRERLENGPRRLPPLVHAQRQKPWRCATKPSWVREPRGYYLLVDIELSPYTYVARRYREQLDEPVEWMTVRTLPAKALQRLTRGSANLQGLPPAVLTRALRPLRRALARYRGR